MNDKKGFSYTVEDEKLIEYMKLSTEQKLAWLEEINSFTHAVLSDEEKCCGRNYARQRFSGFFVSLPLAVISIKII